MENKYIDPRIFKNDKNGFEVHFKPQKFGAYLALAFSFSFMIIDYVLFKETYIYAEFKFLLYNPIYALGFIALKLAIIYTLYLAIYTFFSNYIVKLDKETLSKFSSPVPRLRGNKSILRNDIENFYLKKGSSSSYAGQDSNVRIKQTYYNLRIKTKDKNEFTFFYSLLQDETNLIKKLLEEHLNL